MIASIVKASRPVSWINTAYPFAAGYLTVERHVDALLVVGTLFFLIPYNLLMYGVNDVFDYESDLLNPRKGGIEGDVVRDRAQARRVHRGIIAASALTVAPLMAWLVVKGTPQSAIALAVGRVIVPDASSTTLGVVARWRWATTSRCSSRREFDHRLHLLARLVPATPVRAVAI